MRRVQNPKLKREAKSLNGKKIDAFWDS